MSDDKRSKPMMVLMGGRKLTLDDYLDFYRKLKRREPTAEETEDARKDSEAKGGSSD